MLESKCVGDNFEMLVTILSGFVTNILCLSTLASGTNIQNQAFQNQPLVTNVDILSLASKNCHQDKVNNIHLSPTSM